MLRELIVQIREARVLRGVATLDLDERARAAAGDGWGCRSDEAG